MLFKDKGLQKELEQHGFVVIPFLSNDEILELNHFYDTIHKSEEPPNFIEDIHMTIWCKDSIYKKNVSDNLTSIFSNASEQYFENYRRLNHVFIVKKNGKDTSFKVHQDWNVVDETKYQSVNVWVPLHDVDENSGALWVLKGSHNIDRKVRGSGYLFPDYSNYTKELEKVAVSVKLKAGEAIVFYHSVIHGSPPNLSDSHRKAACFSVIPEKAPLCIYFQPKENESLKQYEPSDDFMFNYDYLRTEASIIPPADKPINTFSSYINTKVNAKELKTFISTNKSVFSFWKR